MFLHEDCVGLPVVCSRSWLLSTFLYTKALMSKWGTAGLDLLLHFASRGLKQVTLKLCLMAYLMPSFRRLHSRSEPQHSKSKLELMTLYTSPKSAHDPYSFWGPGPDPPERQRKTSLKPLWVQQQKRFGPFAAYFNFKKCR